MSNPAGTGALPATQAPMQRPPRSPTFPQPRKGRERYNPSQPAPHLPTPAVPRPPRSRQREGYGRRGRTGAAPVRARPAVGSLPRPGEAPSEAPRGAGALRDAGGEQRMLPGAAGPHLRCRNREAAGLGRGTGGRERSGGAGAAPGSPPKPAALEGGAGKEGRRHRDIFPLRVAPLAARQCAGAGQAGSARLPAFAIYNPHRLLRPFFRARRARRERLPERRASAELRRTGMLRAMPR